MDQTAIAQTAELTLTILTPALTIFFVWAAHRLIKIFETKTGIDIPDKQESKIDVWIDEGIHFAAEKSHKKVKELTEKLTGPEKLEEAADYVFALAASRGWVDWTKEKIRTKVEAQLGIRRAELLDT